MKRLDEHEQAAVDRMRAKVHGRRYPPPTVCVPTEALRLVLDALDARTTAKSRDLAGEANPSARLTADDVRTMRRRHAGGATARVLAVEYGISMPHTYAILARRRWKDTP